MKKEENELLIIDQEFEVIVAPNDQLGEQLDHILGGGGAGEPGCTFTCVGYCQCKKSNNTLTTPPGQPGAQ